MGVVVLLAMIANLIDELPQFRTRMDDEMDTHNNAIRIKLIIAKKMIISYQVSAVALSFAVASHL